MKKISTQNPNDSLFFLSISPWPLMPRVTGSTPSSSLWICWGRRLPAATSDQNGSSSSQTSDVRQTRISWKLSGRPCSEKESSLFSCEFIVPIFIGLNKRSVFRKIGIMKLSLQNKNDSLGINLIMFSWNFGTGPLPTKRLLGLEDQRYLRI